MQTHLIFTDEEIQPLWRPQANTAEQDPKQLLGVLERAIEQYDIQPKTESLPKYHHPRFEQDGLHFLSVVRIPFQENHDRQSAYAIDWIDIPSKRISELLPPTPSTQTYEIPSDLAQEILIQFRAPLETAQDPDSEVLKLIQESSIQAKQAQDIDGSPLLVFTGSIRLATPKDYQPSHPEDDKRTRIVEEHIRIVGYAKWEPHTQKILQANWLIQEAYIIPPNGKKTRFVGMAQQIRSLDDL